MSADFDKLREIFLAALEQAPEQRDAYLDQICAGDNELRRNIAVMLKAQAVGEGPLDRAAVRDEQTGAYEQVSETPGTVIGPYKLIEQIGEGGMGTVWMAQQTEPVKRLVAVKLIKAGMDSRQVIARFEAERQALALMDHANIARVLEAGTTDASRPYFVMDLVKGVPITRYCDEHHLTPWQRLELFIPVCQAVQHAHQKGIIHRDLKPSNVLVALYDGKPVPKVIDFGVAKAAGQQLTDKTLVTGFGNIIGTLEYMSPEQAEINQIDIDTRSDIYSLGVLLYELLTGSPPFCRKELETAGMLEMLRVIREQEPSKPSTKLSTADGLPTLAANRGTEPSKLTKLVRGELDWIVMKALEKDRNRRYETANDLAMDVQRYLTDEPVLACPPSAGYRLRKFARRNNGPLLAVSLVVLALMGAIIGTTWGMIRAKQEHRNALLAQYAEAERTKGERQAKEEVQKRLAQIVKGTETLASVFRELDPTTDEQEGVTLRVLLGRRLGEAAQQLEGEAVGDTLVVARLQHLLGISLRELGHLEQAEVVLVKASQTRERLLGADHLDTVATNHHLARLYRDQGKYALAEPLLQEVLAARTARLGAEHPDTLTSRHHLAILYHNQRKYDVAEALCKEVLAVRTAKLGADHSETLASRHRLALLHRSQCKFALAEALHKEVLAIRTAKLGADHLDTVATKDVLADLYREERMYALAETLANEVVAVRTAKLGADHPDTLTSRHHLALLYQAEEKYALAEALCKDVLAVRTAKLGADHRATLQIQCDLAVLYLAQGKYALTEALYKDVLAIRTAKLEVGDRATLQLQLDLASLYRLRKKFDQSIPLFEETFKLKKVNFGPDHPDTLEAQVNLGANYSDAGRFADAIALLEEVYQKKQRQQDSDYLDAGNALLTAYVRAGKTTQATALTTEQVRAARKWFRADSFNLADTLADTGKALLDAKAYAAAEPLLRESLSLGEQKFPDAWITHHARSLLGGALLGQDKYADAEPLLLQGYQGMHECQAPTFVEDPWGRLTLALERLVRLYDAADKPLEAAKWRKELEKRKEPQ